MKKLIVLFFLIVLSFFLLNKFEILDYFGIYKNVIKVDENILNKEIKILQVSGRDTLLISNILSIKKCELVDMYGKDHFILIGKCDTIRCYFSDYKLKSYVKFTFAITQFNSDSIQWRLNAGEYSNTGTLKVCPPLTRH